MNLKLVGILECDVCPSTIRVQLEFEEASQDTGAMRINKPDTLPLGWERDAWGSGVYCPICIKAKTEGATTP